MNDVPPGRVGGSRAPPARLPLVYGASEPARTGAAFVLGHCGMRVLTADSARAALQILDRELVDVIVRDIRLSGEGGVDGMPAFCLTQHVKLTNSNWSSA